jgi:hypothetical protein
MRRTPASCFLFVLSLLIAACAHKNQPAAPPRVASVEVIEAQPAKGFHYPYILRLPSDPVPPFLLVEPNNTGTISDDFQVHFDAAHKLSGNAIGAYVASKLNLPLLVPVFPRPETDWQIYTHLLDRDTIEIAGGPMRRLDLQLLAMIDDARGRLRARGIKTHDEVLLTGFSASGSFVNRFTMLHPERVRAVAAGGLNALLMLPLEQSGSSALPFPIGVADVATMTGRPFQARAWRRVPQFLYMGADDRNDAVDFDDGYSEAERTLVHTAIGKEMPVRWETGQRIYREFGANAEFRTYAGVGHWTDAKINDEVTEFFRRSIEK